MVFELAVVYGGRVGGERDGVEARGSSGCACVHMGRWAVEIESYARVSDARVIRATQSQLRNC